MALASTVMRRDTLPLTAHIPVGIAISMGILQGIAGSLGGLGSQQIRVTRAPKISTNLVRVRGPIILRLREPPTDSRQDRMLKNIKEDVSNS
jgi:hypothetical protein